MMLLYLVLFVQISVVYSVTLDEEAQSYLKEVIKRFNENPTNPVFDHIIEPPVDRAYLPSIFLWAPLEHFGFTMKCLKHPDTNLRPKGWTDDLLTPRSNRNPRLIFDLRRNILLIQRYYHCTAEKGDTFLAGSIELMSHFPVSLTPNHFPFKKYHQSMVTFDLIDYIFHQIINRVAFQYISEGISSINFGYFQRVIGFSERNFHDNVLYSFPSGDKIQTIFLDTYYSIRQLLESTRSLPSSSISIDHTHRLGRSFGDKNKKDHMKVFTILNEQNEIVSWKATKNSGDSDEYMPLLMELKYKLDVTGTSLAYAYLENCCDMRDIYTSLFPGVAVKLDLYHASTSVIECLPEKKNVLPSIFAKDLRKIVRQPGDHQDKRELETASPSIIMRNLMDLLSKQESYLNSIIENKRQEVMNRLEILKEHIIMGCLSYIPVEQGCDSIEKYHQDFLKGDQNRNNYYVMSPELAIAIFALLCASYNSRANIRKHSCNVKVVPYLPKTYLSPFLQKPEEPESLTIDDFALLASGNIMTNNMLARVAYDVYYVYNFLKKMKNSCDTVEFKVESAIKFLLNSSNRVTPSNQDHDHSYGVQNKEKLCKNLKSFNLTLDAVPADGDCLFRSILMQVYKKLAVIEPWHKLTRHVEKLGLRSSDDEQTLVIILRQLFVQELKSEERYQSYMTKEDISDVDSYLAPGVYASNIGDLVVDVCADILGTPIVVVSSLCDLDISIHLPKTKQQIDSPIFIAYNATDSGHYDGTKPYASGSQDDSTKEDFRCLCSARTSKAVLTCLSNEKYSTRCPCRKAGRPCNFRCVCKLCGNSKTRPEKRKKSSCRCGQNKKKASENEAFQSCLRGRRCPCSGSMYGCSEFCQCRNCANEFGLRPEKDLTLSTTPTVKRKRADTSYSRPKMAEFSTEDDVSAKEVDKKWTLEEVSTLLCSMNLLLRIPSTVLTVEGVHLVYTSARDSYAVNNMGMRLNMRTLEQIEEKLIELGFSDLFQVHYIE